MIVYRNIHTGELISSSTYSDLSYSARRNYEVARGSHHSSSRFRDDIEEDGIDIVGLGVSAVVGAVTDSAILGGLVGGSMIGGILGDLTDGDLLD